MQAPTPTTEGETPLMAQSVRPTNLTVDEVGEGTYPTSDPAIPREVLPLTHTLPRARVDPAQGSREQGDETNEATARRWGDDFRAVLGTSASLDYHAAYHASLPLWSASISNEDMFASMMMRRWFVVDNRPDLEGRGWLPPAPFPPGDTGSFVFERYSPVNVGVLEKSLRDHPNRALVSFLLEGFTKGFRAGARTYTGGVPRALPNRQSAIAHPGPLRTWLGKERAAARVLGPFREPPHPNLQLVPLGLIPKSRSIPIELKSRTITDYSATWRDGAPSLNQSIDPADCVCNYMKIMHLVRLAISFEKEGGVPFFCSSDLRDAFRNLPLNPQDWWMAGFAIPNEAGAVEYYVDRAMSFGCSSNPATFDAFASALQWALAHRARSHGVKVEFGHLLDDFAAVGFNEIETWKGSLLITLLFKELGIPEQPEKVVRPTRRSVILGLVIDLLKRTLEIPDDKREDMTARLRAFAHDERVKTKEAESLLGKLGFVDVVIPCARARTTTIYAAVMPAVRGDRHWTTPSKAAREDAEFLARVIDAGPAISWDALVLSPATATEVWCVDASGPDGAGGFSLTGATPRWFHASWPSHWRNEQDEGAGDPPPAVSSTAQEAMAALIATTLASALEMSVERPHRMLVWTDSQALVGAVGKGRSPSPRLNEALMHLQELGARIGVLLMVQWHGRDSCLAAKAADALSHGDLQMAATFIPALGGASRMDLPSQAHQILQDKPRSL